MENVLCGRVLHLNGMRIGWHPSDAVNGDGLMTLTTCASPSPDAGGLQKANNSPASKTRVNGILGETTIDSVQVVIWLAVLHELSNY